MTDPEQPQSSIILYQTEDGRTRIECRFENETLWLTQKLIGELFQIGVNTVSHHLKEIYDEGELDKAATIRHYRIVQTEGTRQNITLHMKAIYTEGELEEAATCKYSLQVRMEGGCRNPVPRYDRGVEKITVASGLYRPTIGTMS